VLENMEKEKKKKKSEEEEEEEEETERKSHGKQLTNFPRLDPAIPTSWVGGLVVTFPCTNKQKSGGKHQCEVCEDERRTLAFSAHKSR
jgi:hypothetical protein